MAKQIILIDGENLVHKLVDSLKLAGQKPERDALLKLRLDELLCNNLHMTKLAKTNYYTAQVKQNVTNATLQKKTHQMIAWNGRWAPWLQNLGIKYIKAGMLQVRDTKKCQYCGKKSLVLQEKGVDVRLATDILIFAGKGNKIFLVSSDSDLIPAIKVARQQGTQVVYVPFTFAVNRALVASCDKTITIDEIAVKEAL